MHTKYHKTTPQNPTTSVLTATILSQAEGAGITAAAGHFYITIPVLTSEHISLFCIDSLLLYETALHSKAPLRGD